MPQCTVYGRRKFRSTQKSSEVQRSEAFIGVQVSDQPVIVRSPECQVATVARTQSVHFQATLREKLKCFIPCRFRADKSAVL